MQKISVLSDLVIDQIAAGEVLEHPASAVKELVENSIDAGAGEIRIEIEGGGLQRLLIDDDGSGMSRIDAELCLKRHATSKIRSADDLQKLMTMGFRGEALAAIRSVSLLELRTSNGEESTHVHSDGRVGPCARNRGTTIEVRGLFQNTPARLKFQKSPSACAAAVLRTVQSLALAHPSVSFRLLSNEKLVFECKSADWKRRAEEILGPLEHEVNFSEGGIEVRGLAGRPEEGKGNRSGQNLYVNERPIASPLVARAVKEGFGTRMAESLYPVFLLFIRLSPDAVDVNVHPQKREVRFRDEGKIFHVVRKAVEKALGKEEVAIAPMPWDFTPAPSTPFILQDAPLFHPEPSLPIESKGRPVALIGDFLLVEEGGWKWIDLRGAEARILFEQMESGKPSLQPLMWPHEMELGIGDSAEETADLLKEVGVEARAMGKRKIAVDALPAGMETAHIEPFIQQFLAQKSERRLAASLTRVCRASSRRFSFEEGALIWRKLASCSDRNYDPLGKKIAAVMGEEQLAEFFV